MELSREQEIVKLLFKDFLNHYNSRSISRVIGISHPGAFKILKRLEEREIVRGMRIGKAVIYSLNMDNPVAIKEVEMALVVEAQNYKKWIEEFKKLEERADFAILFGSVIVNEKSARDIDILIVAEKNRYNKIKKIVNEKNQISNKNIHLIFQNPEEFRKDVNEKNKVSLEIIKKGVVLFGQDKMRKSIKI